MLYYLAMCLSPLSIFDLLGSFPICSNLIFNSRNTFEFFQLDVIRILIKILLRLNQILTNYYLCTNLLFTRADYAVPLHIYF